MSTPTRTSKRKTPEFNLVKRFYANPSRKNAILAFCAHCMGCTAKEQGGRYEDHIERGYAEQIRNCTAPGCPLYRYRPFQVKE